MPYKRSVKTFIHHNTQQHFIRSISSLSAFSTTNFHGAPSASHHCPTVPNPPPHRAMAAAHTWDDSGSYVVTSSPPTEGAPGGGVLDYITSSNSNIQSPIPTPTGSAGGSLQNDGGSVLLGGDGGGSTDSETYGFSRPEMFSKDLVGSVGYYERHVVLCYKNPESWPPQVEAAEFDRLPRLLAAALKQRKNDITRKTRLTICEGRDGTETSNGDVLIFPDMIRYKGLTHFDVDTFVEEVLVKDTEWPSGNPEPLSGHYVFVCAHASRDKRCGVCGPALIKKFKEELDNQGNKAVSVSPCSHIGGHKYAGNVIIYGPNAEGGISGHWYGYVVPDDVPVLLEQHIGKSEIVDRLWRGQMGLSEEEQIKAQLERAKLHGESNVERSAEETYLDESTKLGNENDLSNNEKVNDRNSFGNEGVGCCQGNKSRKCCQSLETEEAAPTEVDTRFTSQNGEVKTGKSSSSKGCLGKSFSGWFENWEFEDTVAALAVIGAAATVVVAFKVYSRQT